MLSSGTQPRAGPVSRGTGHPLQLVLAGPCWVVWAGCAAQALPGDAAVACPGERCPARGGKTRLDPDQELLPGSAPGAAPGPLPMCWGRGRGGSREADADVAGQSSQHPVGGWGELGEGAAVGRTTLLLPHPAAASSLLLYGDVQQAVRSPPRRPLPCSTAGTVPWWPLMWPIPPLHGPGTC